MVEQADDSAVEAKELQLTRCERARASDIWEVASPLDLPLAPICRDVPQI